MPKCLRFGWTPRETQTPYETNVWKRVYSFNIQALQTMPVRVCQYDIVIDIYFFCLCLVRNTCL